MKLYFDSLTTLEVIHAESLIVIFFGHMVFIQFQRRVIVTAVLAIVRTELGEQFLWFWNMTSCDFTLFYSLLTKANVNMFRCAW